MQSSNTELLIFDVPTTIARISEFTTLQPGGVILTGTPRGVGARGDPQVFLNPGDVVRVEIPESGSSRTPSRPRRQRRPPPTGEAQLVAHRLVSSLDVDD